MNKSKDELWDLVSQFVRQSAADQYGMVRCFTCGKRMRYQDAHAGHFVGRIHGATRYHLDNSRVQCEKCNCDLDGNLEVYRERLIQEIGIERVENLERLSKTVNKLSRSDREEMIEYYRDKLKTLKKAA